MLTRWLITLTLLLSSGLAAAAKRTPEQVFTYSLLTDDYAGRVVVGAKAVERKPDLAPDALDVAAAVLAERAARSTRLEIEVDTSAWLIRALGAGHQARHRGVVERAVAAYQLKKIDRYAEPALLGMTQGDPTPTAGIDLAALRAELQAERESMQGSNRDPDAVGSGESLASVLGKLGYPQSVNVATRRDGHMHVQVTSYVLRLFFEDIGTMDVALGDGSGPTWVVARYNPRLVDYSGSHPVEASIIANGAGRDLRHTAIHLTRTKVREPQLLDIAAERIRKSMGSSNGDEVDGLAHLCRLLGASGDRKHAPLLQEVAEKGADSGLRRHAKRGLDELLGK